MAETAVASRPARAPNGTGAVTYLRRTLVVSYLVLLVAWPVALVARETFSDGFGSLQRALADDLGTANALAAVFDLISALNQRTLSPADAFEAMRAIDAGGHRRPSCRS